MTCSSSRPTSSRPCPARPIPRSGWRSCPDGGCAGWSTASGPTRSTSRPRGRSAGRRGRWRGGAAGRSPPPSTPSSPNMSRRAPGCRPPGAIGVLRRFHGAAAAIMVATPRSRQELERARLRPISGAGRAASTPSCSGRGPRTSSWHPGRSTSSSGGSRSRRTSRRSSSSSSTAPNSWSATGRRSRRLRQRYPAVRFTGYKAGEELAAHVAAADVFVFPSLTDTFGLVLLEALASGVPVAAFPITGPRDVINGHPVGALDSDLGRGRAAGARLRARRLPRLCHGLFLARVGRAVPRQSDPFAAPHPALPRKGGGILLRRAGGASTSPPWSRLGGRREATGGVMPTLCRRTFPLRRALVLLSRPILAKRA